MLVNRGFAFVDLCGFTAYTEENGVQETVRVLSDFRNTLRDIASRRSVRLAKWLGDGAMIVSVDVAPLVDAVLEISHAVSQSSLPLAISAGATAGPAILFEGDDYIAGSVNLASHLCHVAGPSEALITTDLEGCLPSWARVVEERPRDVPGFARPVPTLSIGIQLVEEGDEAVQDPVCRLVLPSRCCPHQRATGGGEVAYFCSDACVSTWDSRILSG